MDTLRVLVVEDHRMVREMLCMTLQTEEGIEVVGEAGDGEEAISKARVLKPDLILMDIEMPVMTGIEACHEIRDRLPDCLVLMLTAKDDEESFNYSLLAGAHGYVLKASGREVLRRAIDAVRRGERFFDPPTILTLVNETIRILNERKQRLMEQLTPREVEVLRWIARGATNREAAKEMGIAHQTVK
ncbi:MAG: response regulator transcription factor, partial [Dehalococcoidia bacterium]|nr:response regulator transcription factor [Dehalococcoidia bacterium]